MSIIERLRDRDICDGDLEDAADMLEFFFGQMQMYSADMGDAIVIDLGVVGR